MARIITLKDNVTDENLYPQTIADAVFGADGNTVAELIAEEHIVSDAEDGVASLSFTDSYGNCNMQIKDGHVKTKEFDSANTNSAITSLNSDALLKDINDSDQSTMNFIDENGECALQIKDGHIKTSNFDSSRIHINNTEFASIGNDKLTTLGESYKSYGSIILSAGFANRAYLDGGFECAHWDMYAKFKCTGGVSFIMGKYNSMWGAWIEIKLDNGVSTYTLYNNGEERQYSQVFSGNLDFSLAEGEWYSLHIFFNVDTKKIIGFEISGQYNEYFTHTFDTDGLGHDISCNGYGVPFFYSKTECIVTAFSLSNQNYYDIRDAKCSVWGHSYVEADSLGPNRDKSFTNLLANALGPQKVFNFGLGGDTFAGIIAKTVNTLVLARNCQYGLICAGANDSGATADYLKGCVDEIAALLQEYDIVPIFMTIAPIYGTINSAFRETNAYIRSKYAYVDQEQVFLDVDSVTGNPTAANIKMELYLPDQVHPTVEGHRYIFNRIKLDCPYLF